MGPCDICGDNPQAMQIGNMETGDQQFVCPPCFARFALDFAKAVLPPEEIAAVLGPMFVAPTQEGGKAPSRKSRRAAEAEVETAEPPVPEDSPAAADAGGAG